MIRIIARLTLGLVIAIIKLSILIISIIAICATLALACHSQIIELKTVPNVTRLGNLHENLFRADSLLRLGDGITSHRNLSDTCMCMHESNIFAPKDSNGAKIATFQTVSSAILYEGHSYLVRRNHTKLAIIVLVADIVSEGYSVGHNAYLQNDIDSHTPPGTIFVTNSERKVK